MMRRMMRRMMRLGPVDGKEGLPPSNPDAKRPASPTVLPQGPDRFGAERA
jgi:hypothetical protein